MALKHTTFLSVRQTTNTYKNTTMKKKNLTLGQYLEALRIIEEERDIHVDGIDSIAYCCEELTEEGKEYFKDALSLPIEDGCVVSYDDDDYDDENENSKLLLAWDMLCALAGLCSISDYKKWVVDDDDYDD